FVADAVQRIFSPYHLVLIRLMQSEMIRCTHSHTPFGTGETVCRQGKLACRRFAWPISLRWSKNGLVIRLAQEAPHLLLAQSDRARRFANLRPGRLVDVDPLAQPPRFRPLLDLAGHQDVA